MFNHIKSKKNDIRKTFWLLYYNVGMILNNYLFHYVFYLFQIIYFIGKSHGHKYKMKIKLKFQKIPFQSNFKNLTLAVCCTYK